MPQLREGAIPSQLPNCPSYLSGPSHRRESPDSKRARKEQSEMQAAIAESVAADIQYNKSRLFNSADELVGKLQFLDTQYWTLIKNNEGLSICRVVQFPCPKIMLSLKIKNNCTVQAFVQDTEMHRLGDFKIPVEVHDTNTLEKILDNLNRADIDKSNSENCNSISVIQLVISFLSILLDEPSFKHSTVLKFVCEQLHLMTLNKMDYSSELVIFSSILYNCSPQGYRLLRDKKFLILPSYSTIKRVFVSKKFSPATEQDDTNFLLYIKNKSKSLLPCDKTVILMVDEIHLKPYFDYKGGNIVGSAFDSSEAATSAFVFMLNSVRSKFKDVVHIIPTKCMKAETLHNILKKVIIGLEKIGFTVFCVVTDNNAINGKAMSFFAHPPKLSIVYRHPYQNDRPLFFMYDSVHLLKCIRNNWVGQKDTNQTMKFPPFAIENYTIQTELHYAPFSTLKKLQKVEDGSLLKHSYKLSLKALSPSSFEKQNVNLVLQIFNEYVIQALLTVGKNHCLSFYAHVSEYIKIFYTWWTIMNVKSPFKGKRLNHEYATPITNNSNDAKFQFLKDFYVWLEVWDEIKEFGGTLTKETFTALKHTTNAMLEVTDYCMSELHMEYVLTGKFQTDNLESRFGQYRQLAGGHYNISVRQVFECEKKLRMMSVLKQKLPFHDRAVHVAINNEINWNDLETAHNVKGTLGDISLQVTSDDIENCKDEFPIITYLAGYCCYSVYKKRKCNSCKEMITGALDEETFPENQKYLSGISRGSLLYPHDTAANIVMYCYIIINKLTQIPNFRTCNDQRNFASALIYNILVDDEGLFPNEFCDSGHSTEQIEKMMIWASTNVLLNNYCCQENNSIVANKNLTKKRKFETVMNK